LVGGTLIGKAQSRQKTFRKNSIHGREGKLAGGQGEAFSKRNFWEKKRKKKVPQSTRNELFQDWLRGIGRLFF